MERDTRIKSVLVPKSRATEETTINGNSAKARAFSITPTEVSADDGTVTVTRNGVTVAEATTTSASTVATLIDALVLDWDDDDFSAADGTTTLDITSDATGASFNADEFEVDAGTSGFTFEVGENDVDGSDAAEGATGVPLLGAQTLYAHIVLAAVGATSVVYQVQAANVQNPTLDSQLADIADADLTVSGADANTQKVITVAINRSALAEAMKFDPLYFFLKRTQVGAVATVDAVSFVFTDHKELPQLVNNGAAATVEVL